MSETQQPTRATRTKEAAPAVTDELLARIVEATEQRLATRPNPMALNTFEEIEAFANHAARTQMVPKDYVGKPDNIILAVMQGKELGLPPIQAIQSIAMVNGRPSVWGDAVPGLCYARGLVEDHEEHFEGDEGTDGFTAICTVKRRGVASVKTARFSQGDAKKAGLFGQNVHGKYPRRMMQWRARHAAFHDAFPDVLRGIGTRELEAEDAVATPGWTMPVPEKGWFSHKPQAQSDGWDDTWFSGAVQKLAGEPNAWKWLDLFVAVLADAPTPRDVAEIGDLPMVAKVREGAPPDGLKAMDDAVAAAGARFAKASEPEKEKPSPDIVTKPTSEPAKTVQQPAQQTAATAAAADFSAWLVDGEGTAIDGPDGEEMLFIEPMDFIVAYVDYLASSAPGDVELIRGANKDSVVKAQILDPAVSRVLVDAQGQGTAKLPLDMPAEPTAVRAPQKPTKGEQKRYLDELGAIAVAAAAKGEEALRHAKEANGPTIADLKPDSLRMQARALFEAEERKLTPPAPTTGQGAKTPDDQAYQLELDIASFDTLAEINAWFDFQKVQDELRALPLELRNKVLDKMEQRRAALTPKPAAAAPEPSGSLFDELAEAAPAEDTPRQRLDAMKKRITDCTEAPQVIAIGKTVEFLTFGKSLAESDPAMLKELKDTAVGHIQRLRASSQA